MLKNYLTHRKKQKINDMSMPTKNVVESKTVLKREASEVNGRTTRWEDVQIGLLVELVITESIACIYRM